MSSTNACVSLSIPHRSASAMDIPLPKVPADHVLSEVETASINSTDVVDETRTL